MHCLLKFWDQKFAVMFLIIIIVLSCHNCVYIQSASGSTDLIIIYVNIQGGQKK